MAKYDGSTKKEVKIAKNNLTCLNIECGGVKSGQHRENGQYESESKMAKMAKNGLSGYRKNANPDAKMSTRGVNLVEFVVR